MRDACSHSVSTSTGGRALEKDAGAVEGCTAGHRWLPVDLAMGASRDRGLGLDLHAANVEHCQTVMCVCTYSDLFCEASAES